jgi:large subunit ribosomal protein L6
MSRVAKKPVDLPQGVTVTIGGESVTVKGAKGSLTLALKTGIKVVQPDKQHLAVEASGDGEGLNAIAGSTRAHLANMVTGVTKGYEEVLELVGVGYRAALKGQALSMQLGFSHDVDIPPPKGITFAVPKQTEVRISGIDKQLVGEIAARIRRIRPPEPYKGKGVRYAGEAVRRKEGKKK